MLPRAAEQVRPPKPLPLGNVTQTSINILPGFLGISKLGELNYLSETLGSLDIKNKNVTGLRTAGEGLARKA